MDHKNFSNKSNLPAAVLVENEFVRTDSLKFLKCLRKFFTITLVEICHITCHAFNFL